MKIRKSFSIILAIFIIGGCSTAEKQKETSQIMPRVLPGMTDKGTVLLPNQWSLKPAGSHLPIGDLPLNMKFSPDGNFLAIAHCGYGPNEIVIVKIPQNAEEKEEIISRAKVNVLWYGLTFNHDGSKLYAGGGTDDVIYEFDFKDGYLGNQRKIDIYEENKKILPAGIVITKNGKTLYTANTRNHSVGIVNLELKTPKMEFIPLPNESYPYTCLLSSDEKTLYVSLWGKAQVAEIDLSLRAVRRVISTDDHPNEMIMTKDGKKLLVSNANENTVSIIDTATGKAIVALSSALYPNAPEGSTPNSLALTEDEEYLLIANADNNNLAVFEIEEDEPIRGVGYIPVGWYPTSVRIHPKTQKIYVADGKGQSSKANVLGPNPGKKWMSTTEYIGGLYTGTLTSIDWPDDAKLYEYTQDAYSCSPYIEGSKTTFIPDEKNPIPFKLGNPSPIKYCVYIIKENRTYDQVFGDISKGNGDPYLCLFPEKVTPNHHAIAQNFVLLDNFYVESEVSADGHEWSMGAYATDFVEKNWPHIYGHDGKWQFGYPAEGFFDVATPTSGYIWDKCVEAGISYRSYGEFVEDGETPQDPGTVRVKTLEGHFDPYYQSYDLKYSDIDRANRFITELKQFERNNDLPQFIVLRLPNDHTAGGRPGYPTPTAMVAENDLALGMIMEALSNSRFWSEMAVFVVEDDAQNGPDHVDAHRTVALVASPYCKRDMVDSSFYSTASMLRTMELILGLQPMSQFDAAARPMFASFKVEPDFSPYKCVPAKVDIRAMNVADAWGAKESVAMNLEVEDAADDIRFNEIIWKNVRGADSEMPAPVRAAFVFPLEKDDD